MNLPHPFQWLTPLAQRRALWLILPLTWFVMYCLISIGEPLETPAAPNGIVSFELAGSMARANEIGLSWMPAQIFYAGLSLGLDYLYIPLYAASIALCCVLLSREATKWLSLCGTLLAWAQFLAAGLDAIENYALIRIMQGEQLEFWPALARNCAIPKFALVALGLFFVFVVGLVRLFQFLLKSKNPEVKE